ncbi:hypothetical protein N185_32435 [Sinorhizobium sp. GW3]|nr:hypothetical protein N185_32435 [Sinorhizobium sp. GW3]
MAATSRQERKPVSRFEKTAPEPRVAFYSDDSLEILGFATDSLDRGHRIALLFLVEIRGGAARPLGAQMAVREDGLYCGFVSGGCTESALAAEALLAIEQGVDRTVRLGEGSPFFDIALPCGGGITIAIHVVRSGSVLRHLVCKLQGRDRICLRYIPSSETLCLESGEGRTSWEDGSFIRLYRPRIRVILAGRSIETQTVARVAASAGYAVLLLDRDKVPSRDQLDQDTAVALMNHDLELDLPLLSCALTSPAFYIGALGSSRTHARRREALLAHGYGEADIARVKAPIGIFDKARDSSALALSVVADIAHARQSASGRRGDVGAQGLG